MGYGKDIASADVITEAPEAAGRRALHIFRSRHGTRWKVWDFLVGLTAFSAGFAITPYENAMPARYYIFVVGCIYGMMLLIFSRLCGVPTPEQRGTKYELATSAALAVAITYLCFAVLVGLLLMRTYGRYIVGTTLTFSLAGMIIPRWCLMQVLKMRPLNVVVYGAGAKGHNLAKILAFNPHFRVLGFLDNNANYHNKERFGYPVFGDIHTFGAKQLHRMHTDLVVICVSANKLVERNAREIMQLPLSQIEVLHKGAFIEQYFKEISVEYDCPQWFASSPSLPGNPSIFAAKRLMDAGISAAALLLTLPAWPFIALAIKLDSKGPVFFKQERIGWHNKPFQIIKFRTMTNDAEKDGPQWAKKNDHRVTCVGRFLRLSRIDELPQLWNVLKGEMSLVGPRPERPEFVEMLAQEIPFYEQRHLVPPGLTGYAQVRYRYGSSKEDAVRKLQYELYYVRHLSLRFDIEILLRTIPLVMKGSR